MDYLIPEDNATSQEKMTIMSEKSGAHMIFASNLPIVQSESMSPRSKETERQGGNSKPNAAVFGVSINEIPPVAP